MPRVDSFGIVLLGNTAGLGQVSWGRGTAAEAESTFQQYTLTHTVNGLPPNGSLNMQDLREFACA